jgi:hypothetical protein
MYVFYVLLYIHYVGEFFILCYITNFICLFIQRCDEVNTFNSALYYTEEI